MRNFIVEIFSIGKTALRSFLVPHTPIQYGSAPLGIAAGKGHTKTVQRLLEAGANVNYRNKVMTINTTYLVVTQQQHISILLAIAWQPKL